MDMKLTLKITSNDREKRDARYKMVQLLVVTRTLTSAP